MAGPLDMPPAQDVEVWMSQVKIIAEERVFPLLLETFLLALDVILTLYIVHRQRIARKTTPMAHPVLFVTLGMFVIFLAVWIIDVYLLWEDIYKFLPQRQDVVPTPMLRGVLTDAGSGALYAQRILGNVMVIVGDGVVQWRAYVIFGRPPWLYRLMVFMFVAECVLYAVATLYGIVGLLPHLHASSLLWGSYDRIWTPLISCALVLTAFVQSLSTSLIAYKTWCHWKEIREIVPHPGSQLTIAVLAILVESGVVYTIIWAAYIATNFSEHSILFNWSNSYTVPLIAMYPALVIVLVATRRSILERGIGSTPALSDIRCALPGMSSHQEARYPRDTFKRAISEIGVCSKLDSGRTALSEEDLGLADVGDNLDVRDGGVVKHRRGSLKIPVFM
ncbi:hypothetical protein PENSPDRAFT_653065 [Peniophora sp. CONT]|nr:hypothetical protein PENSPDRAFT_653065 [Peniophora sp. CONT]